MNPIVVLSIIAGVAFIATAAIPVPPKYEAEMDALERQALDDSFEVHMRNLFTVYMREPDPDPSKPLAGADKLRAFYAKVRAELDKREANRLR